MRTWGDFEKDFVSCSGREVKKGKYTGNCTCACHGMDPPIRCFKNGKEFKEFFPKATTKEIKDYKPCCKDYNKYLDRV